jgi:uncharacterized membrane protein YccF (DUF307 family)
VTEGDDDAPTQDVTDDLLEHHMLYPLDPPPEPVAPPRGSLPPSPPPPAAPASASEPQITVTELQTGPGLLVRALWFIFIGWWLTAIVSALAWAAMVTIIGLPLGIWMINRIPTVITLRPRTRLRYQYTDQLGRIVTHDMNEEQPHWVIRGLWFVFFGWWLSAIAMGVGWVLIVLIITLPIGLMIYNRVPFIASLYRY